MRWPLLLLLVIPMFAGCTDAPDEVGTDGITDGSAGMRSATCDADLVCTFEDGSTETYTCEDPEVECIWAEGIYETPVDWTGHTKEGVWLLCGAGGLVPPPSGTPIGLPGCLGQQIQPDGEFQTTADFEWNLTAVDLTLEWTSADATQTGLALNIADNTGGSNLGTWEDSSTFTVSEDVSAEGSTQLLFQVWPVAKDGGGTYVDVTQQEFTLTGKILSKQPVVESVLWVGWNE